MRCLPLLIYLFIYIIIWYNLLYKWSKDMFRIIDTPCGKVKGIIDTDSVKFKGIRYATSERWKYPTLVTSWNGVLEAFSYGPSCYQERAFKDESLTNSFYYNEYRKGLNYTYSEDCLFLNIFTPIDFDENSKYPVIVYIHGGSFRSCSADEKCFMDPIWPTKGVIGVTINYRLGLLGFGCLEGAKEESGYCGNYGLADQITALKWVKNNIASFGGDPNNVTIMGQSAGAMSVQALCFSPESEGLFHKAVMVSGGGINRLMTLQPYTCKMEQFSRLFKETGCKSIQELRKYDVTKLFESYYKLIEENKDMGMIGIPYIDGKYLVDSQYKMLDKLRNIPYLIGSTSEDLMPYILFSMSKKWCLLQDKNNFVPSYLWMFNRELPGDDSKAFHCADMWYWFGTLSSSWRPFQEKDYILMDNMVTYLCEFARNGNPNHSSLPTWEPVSKNNKKAMILGEGNLRMEKVNEFKLFLQMFKRPVVF